MWLLRRGAFPLDFLFSHVVQFPHCWLNFLLSQSSESDVHQRGRGLAARGCRPISPASGKLHFSSLGVFVWKGEMRNTMQNIHHLSIEMPDAWARVRLVHPRCVWLHFAASWTVQIYTFVRAKATILWSGRCTNYKSIVLVSTQFWK